MVDPYSGSIKIGLNPDPLTGSAKKITLGPVYLNRIIVPCPRFFLLIEMHSTNGEHAVLLK